MVIAYFLCSLLMMHCVVGRMLILVYPLVMIFAVDGIQYLTLHWVIWFLYTTVSISVLMLWMGSIRMKANALELIAPKESTVDLSDLSLERQIGRIYGNVQQTKYIEHLLKQKFGEDVAVVIINFLKL